MPESIQLNRQVEDSQAGLRFDQAAAELFPDYSRARLQGWIREGCLTLGGRRAPPKQRVAGGEWLHLDARPEPDTEARPESIPLEVLHADDDVLVVNKQAGLVVHPAAGNPDGTLLNGLLHLDPALAELPRAGIVHRLDKDTSGVMVVARSLRAHTRLVRQMQARKVSRRYEAVACGHAPAEGTVDAPVGRDPLHRQRMAVVPSGRPAVSHFRRLRTFGHFSHVEVSLETGRTHQIRVHMQHIDLPLAGDPTYGPGRNQQRTWPEPVREAVDALGRQALHARTLAFKHPESGKVCSFEAPLPADFGSLLDTLEKHDP